MSDKLKAIVAALASALAIVNTVMQHYQPPAGTDPAALDWRTIAVQVAIPLLVYFVPNLPEGFAEFLQTMRSASTTPREPLPPSN